MLNCKEKDIWLGDLDLLTDNKFDEFVIHADVCEFCNEILNKYEESVLPALKVTFESTNHFSKTKNVGIINKINFSKEPVFVSPPLYADESSIKKINLDLSIPKFRFFAKQSFIKIARNSKFMYLAVLLLFEFLFVFLLINQLNLINEKGQISENKFSKISDSEKNTNANLIREDNDRLEMDLKSSKSENKTAGLITSSWANSSYRDRSVTNNTISLQTIRSKLNSVDIIPDVKTELFGGPKGLFTIYDGTTLRRGEYTFSIAYSNYDSDPGNVDLVEVPVSFQIGLEDYLGLFFNTDAYRGFKAHSPHNLSISYLPDSNCSFSFPAIVLDRRACNNSAVYRPGDLKYFQPILELRSTQYFGGRAPYAFENNLIKGMAGDDEKTVNIINIASVKTNTIRTTFSSMLPGLQQSTDPYGFLLRSSIGRRNSRLPFLQMENQFVDVKTLNLNEVITTSYSQKFRPKCIILNPCTLPDSIKRKNYLLFPQSRQIKESKIIASESSIKIKIDNVENNEFSNFRCTLSYINQTNHEVGATPNEKGVCTWVVPLSDTYKITISHPSYQRITLQVKGDEKIEEVVSVKKLPKD